MRTPRGKKAERTCHLVTHNPSSASPGETLYIRCPKLQSGVVLVPNSLDLVFDLVVEQPIGDDQNYVVQNVAKNIIGRMVLKFQSEILSDLSQYHLIETYRDWYLPQVEREEMLKYGIQTENLRKLRSGAAGADGNAAELLLAIEHEKRYAIKLYHPITSDHGVAYPTALGSHIEIEITLAPASQLIVGGNGSYKLANIRLAFETIHDETLAKQIAGNYASGKSFLYEHVQHFRSINFKESATIINENVNVPRRSLTGILILFTGEPRDSEQFVNPAITHTAVSVEGIANKIHAQGMRPGNFWEEARRYFAEGKPVALGMMGQYLVDKFCLFVDLRSFKDRDFHGTGLGVINTKDGIQLEIKRKSTATDDHDNVITAHVYVLADAMMTIEGTLLKTITF